MKKLLLVLGLMTAVAFGRCSDDKEDGNSELAGTVWFYEEGTILSSKFWQERIEFKSASAFEYSYLGMGGVTVKDEGAAMGSYVYNPPVVTRTVAMDGKTVQLRGEIDGSKMTVYIDGEKYEVYKLDEK